ncbi:MAG: GFA family protein [Candidatus Thiodiazotropha weberae]|nr:GFA family protein [Candidatus Thiodiazotropha endoloripes]MCG7898384.1 GFA family protein [Candidatus Thiodiazotropha weberae]MCG7902432.1 GFA family protein [Candidatus Thiodiazotropha weberae]MCG7912888.1 GFA family protein [Candidatus Thiodiazotropha weberae]
MIGEPKVHAYCHCEDCRNLLDVPYHSIVAWDAEQVAITSGEEQITEYKYPTLTMTRVFCKHCGEVLYNTNAMGWKLVSQLLISKCNNGELPDELQSNAHYFYDRRIVDIDDKIPKQ